MSHPLVPVPGNRWDLLDGVVPSSPPSVSIVIPHFEQQAQLDRTLRAVARQTHPADHIEVLVVDDGSTVAPTVPPHVQLLRQDDRGFRAAAARNLGVAAATGEVICFLDADTVPVPTYVERLTRLPALDPDVVTVGRRRHADLAAAAPEADVEEVGLTLELEEPRWLVDAYRDSRDLLDADDRSYRHVISAVLCASSRLLEIVGPFDESFDRYGGEDWEWAHRAWSAGALLAHVHDAVAWHDGPDWSGRDTGDRREAKNEETLRLAQRIGVPGSVPGALRLGPVDIVVEVVGPAERHRLSPAALVVTVDGILAALPGALVAVPAGDAGPLLADRRVHEGPLGAGLLAQVRISVEVCAPVRLDATDLRAAIDAVDGGAGEVRLLASDGRPVARVVALRARRREGRWARHDLFERIDRSTRSAPIDDEPDLAATFGGY